MTLQHFGQHDPIKCVPCRYKSVSVAPSAMPTRSNAYQAKEWNEASERDLPAYKRLHDDGVQPASTVGAADMEKRASEKFEIETGQVAPDTKVAKRYQQAFNEVAGK